MSGKQSIREERASRGQAVTETECARRNPQLSVDVRSDETRCASEPCDPPALGARQPPQSPTAMLIWRLLSQN